MDENMKLPDSHSGRSADIAKRIQTLERITLFLTGEHDPPEANSECIGLDSLGRLWFTSVRLPVCSEEEIQNHH